MEGKREYFPPGGGTCISVVAGGCEEETSSSSKWLIGSWHCFSLSFSWIYWFSQKNGRCVADIRDRRTRVAPRALLVALPLRYVTLSNVNSRAICVAQVTGASARREGGGESRFNELDLILADHQEAAIHSYINPIYAFGRL